MITNVIVAQSSPRSLLGNDSAADDVSGGYAGGAKKYDQFQKGKSIMPSVNRANRSIVHETAKSTRENAG